MEIGDRGPAGPLAAERVDAAPSRGNDSVIIPNLPTMAHTAQVLDIRSGNVTPTTLVQVRYLVLHIAFEVRNRYGIW